MPKSYVHKYIHVAHDQMQLVFSIIRNYLQLGIVITEIALHDNISYIYIYMLLKPLTADNLL